MTKISFEKAVNIISYAGDFDLANDYQFYREDIRKATIEKLIENINEKKISCFGDLAIINNNSNEPLNWQLILKIDSHKKNEAIEKYYEKDTKQIIDSFEVRRDLFSNDKLYIAFSFDDFNDFVEFQNIFNPEGRCKLEIGFVNLFFDLNDIKELAKNPICKEFDFENLQENAQEIMDNAFIEQQKKEEEHYLKEINLELKNENKDLINKNEFLHNQLADMAEELEKANKRIEELENENADLKENQNSGGFDIDNEPPELILNLKKQRKTNSHICQLIALRELFTNPIYLIDKDISKDFANSIRKEFDIICKKNPELSNGICERLIKDPIKDLKKIISKYKLNETKLPPEDSKK